MIGQPNVDDSYFLRYKDKPVKILPFDPVSKQLGLKLIKEVEYLLDEFKCRVLLRGSTLFEISGKGDIEIGVYLDKNDWQKVLEILKVRFGNPGTIEDEYARFSFKNKKKEFEVMMFCGRGAYIDLKLTGYLLLRPDLLKEYEELKKKYSFSRIDYNREKNRFLRKVELEIPD